jgi:hypothetical protein
VAWIDEVVPFVVVQRSSERAELMLTNATDVL